MTIIRLNKAPAFHPMTFSGLSLSTLRTTSGTAAQRPPMPRCRIRAWGLGFRGLGFRDGDMLNSLKSLGCRGY